ncbi:MAG TPA: phosphate ABC transporter permease PstA [Methylomirabilota bacterium]|nr:phosphate ABC transporter permease PstA [Methylomirabilota bacterium]
MPSREPMAVGRPGVSVGTLGTALATVLVVAMLALLLWIVAVNALRWFWPSSLWRLTLDDGGVVVGEVVERRSFHGADQPDPKVLLKVGNRELTGRDHLWLRTAEIASAARPPELVRVARRTNGDATGRIVGFVDLDGQRVGSPSRPAVEALIADALALQGRLEALRREIGEVRSPLTRLEHRAAELVRSDFGRTSEGRRRTALLADEIQALAATLAPALQELRDRREAVVERLGRAHLELRAGDRELTVPLAEVLAVQWPNTLSFGERAATAVVAFGRFLVSEPRQANTEGGIYPALFGTVLMVLLMSLAVMPLGVLTAVYMSEYARPGVGLRIAHHAVNNLAGVPSIVIGIFGLAFFVYGVGGFVDGFFFSERLPTPTFGTGGILWASLTLALLTVPVVVVATREGLQAVPGGWREGALALGATRWQALRRIVLPAALPGILTGLILAVGRAAGEVAPLMLTGAVKLAPSLPVDSSPPFVHLERKFMHLGFHIFDVTMQSPNVEAAKPMAFATTLVLLGLVVAINLTAIVVRRRLRLAYRYVET